MPSSQNHIKQAALQHLTVVEYVLAEMWQRNRQELENPQPLKKLAEKSTMSNLGDVADSSCSKFSCGGKLKLSPEWIISLAYKTVVCHDKDDQCTSTTAAAAAKYSEVRWCSIQFPGADPTAMSKLLGACTVASFGYKGESVVDKSCRGALKLEPKDFMTTFQLCDTPILGEIGLINPNCASL